LDWKVVLKEIFIEMERFSIPVAYIQDSPVPDIRFLKPEAVVEMGAIYFCPHWPVDH
jgi:hypothetical protein